MCWIYLQPSGNLKPYLHKATTDGWQPVLINSRHGSFITILWESKSSAETQQPQPASLRTLACSSSGSALKKTFGSGYRRRVRGSRKEVQTNVGFLCLTYKALCQSVMKKSCANTSCQISPKSSRATYDTTKPIKGESFGLSPGWADETLRQCLWLYLCSYHGSACYLELLCLFSPVSPLAWAPAPVWAVGAVVMQRGLLLPLPS